MASTAWRLLPWPVPKCASCRRRITDREYGRHCGQHFHLWCEQGGLHRHFVDAHDMDPEQRAMVWRDER